MDEKRFVVVLALPMDIDDTWIMVKNKSRGWEFPGGQLEKGELPEEAALRELYEETGILGTAKSVEEDLILGGYVVLVRVEREVSPDPWISSDDSIEEVGGVFKFLSPLHGVERKYSQLSIMIGGLQEVLSPEFHGFSSLSLTSIWFVNCLACVKYQSKIVPLCTRDVD